LIAQYTKFENVGSLLKVICSWASCINFNPVPLDFALIIG